MDEKMNLVGLVHRLATEEAFRHRLMVTPRETLMAELGISGETYSALVALIPVLLAGGLIILGSGTPPGPDNTAQSAPWGRWGS